MFCFDVCNVVVKHQTYIAERLSRPTVIVKATTEGSKSSTSLSITKSVQNVVSCSLSLSLVVTPLGKNQGNN